MTDPKKYPRLYALQVRAARIEEEISAPYRHQVALCRQELSATRRALEAIERAMKSKIIDQVLHEISFRVSDKVRHELSRAVMEAMRGKDRPEVIQLHLSTGDLAFMDPKSLEARALEVWQQETAPKMRLRVYSDATSATMASATVVAVSLPEMHYRHAMIDM